MQVFDGGQPADTEQINCSEKEAELDRAVMDAERIFIDKDLNQKLMWHVWAASAETGQASFRQTWKVLMHLIDCVHKVAD